MLIVSAALKLAKAVRKCEKSPISASDPREGKNNAYARQTQTTRVTRRDATEASKSSLRCLSFESRACARVYLARSFVRLAVVEILTFC